MTFCFAPPAVVNRYVVLNLEITTQTAWWSSTAKEIVMIAMSKTAADLRRQTELVSAFLRQYGGEPGFRPEDIPAPPNRRVRRGHRLLLTVNLPDKGGDPGWLRTLRAWWQFDCTQRQDNWLGVTLDADRVRLAPGVDYQPGIRWVEYDADAYPGASPERALALAAHDDVRLAGAEAIMASTLLPGHVDSWFEGGKLAPNLSVYQYHWNTDGVAWAGSLYLCRFGSKLSLGAFSAGLDDPGWGSPVLRGVL